MTANIFNLKCLFISILSWCSHWKVWGSPAAAQDAAGFGYEPVISNISNSQRDLTGGRGKLCCIDFNRWNYIYISELCFFQKYEKSQYGSYLRSVAGRIRVQNYLSLWGHGTTMFLYVCPENHVGIYSHEASAVAPHAATTTTGNRCPQGAVGRLDVPTGVSAEADVFALNDGGFDAKIIYTYKYLYTYIYIYNCVSRRQDQ